MSKENVQGFYGLVKDNEELTKALEEAVVAGNVVVLAKEKGFEFTQAEHDEFIAEIAAGLGKMSDDQLEEVSGGFLGLPNPQFKLTCLSCNWTTGWQSYASGKTVAMMKAVHIGVTKMAHLDYRVQSRS